MACGWWLVAGGSWLVAGGWWLVAGGLWLVVVSGAEWIMFNFSIVIPVKNDAGNLRLCLAELGGFDDVIIVDSGSTDETAKVAAAAGRQVVQFAWNGQFPKKRNWALRNLKLKHDWVLFLDADERVTAAFAAEAERKIAEGMCNAFWIRYDNWFMGRMLRHGDPMRKLALVKVGCGEYEKIDEDRWSSLDMEIHEQLIVKGPVGTIEARLEHQDRRSLEAYYKKHEEYANWEAHRYLKLDGTQVLTRRQKIKYALMMNPLFPFAYFCACYFVKCGFLDGKAGFVFARGKMRYFGMIQKKIRALRRVLAGTERP